MRASVADLPPDAAAALAEPGPAEPSTVEAAGYAFHLDAWGDPAAPPVLLVHGVTASARIWWRIGPAIAAAGWRVVAVDLPGHGRTGGWIGRPGFRETAQDVAALVRAAGLDRPDLRVVGHSWGAMTVALLPAAGIVPAALVLLDPPAVPRAALAEMVADPAERPYADVSAATAAVAAANPGWVPGDAAAKAEALTQVDPEAARAVLLDNGDWDGAFAALSAPAARRVPATWIVRGDPAAGSLLPDAAAARLATLVGRDHVVTLANAPHSPQRTHPEATLLALLRALGDPVGSAPLNRFTPAIDRV